MKDEGDRYLEEAINMLTIQHRSGSESVRKLNDFVEKHRISILENPLLKEKIIEYVDLRVKVLEKVKEMQGLVLEQIALR